MSIFPAVPMPPSNRHFALAATLLGLVACLLLLPGLGGGFIFDDLPNIVNNGNLRVAGGDTGDLLYAAYSYNGGKARSLSMLSLALDLWRGGQDPVVFKTTNLLLHALTTLVLALFYRMLLHAAGCRPRQAALGALAMAALWAFHPLQVSSVLYVVQRMQMLSTLFVLAALCAYLAMRQAQIRGERSRHFGLAAVLFAALAFASKEDAVLLPAYMLALELTVLRLRAASPALARRLRMGYAAVAVAGLAAYLLLVLPHYWQVEPYPGRDFNSSERLLSQGRVLAMYLGQVVMPLPRLLPFYYDTLAISHGWLQPPTTLAAWLLLVGLLLWAWHWRTRRPLFALGVFLFFAGHFLTSNVLNLELAFEHRNHFPLVGAVLALADLGRWGWQRLRLPTAAAVAALVLLAGVEASATAARAHLWGEPLRLAQHSVQINPHSSRAWLSLCGAELQRADGKPNTPAMTHAIDVCAKGAEATGSPQLLSNVVIFKTQEGTVTQADWTRFLDALRAGARLSHNHTIAMVTLTNLERGIPLDEDGVLQTFELINAHVEFPPHVYLRIARYIHNRTSNPERALPYLQEAMRTAAPGDPQIEATLAGLEQAGRTDWVRTLRVQQAQSRH